MASAFPTAHQTLLTESVIADRLRAAGCVFAEDEALVLLSVGSSPERLAADVERRVAGVPLEQIVGWAEFAGVRVFVEPGVFVPRRRTEILVREAVRLARPHPVVLDLCCGSGGIGAAIASRVDKVELHASDVEPAAVRCARRNIPDAVGTVYEGDLFEPLPSNLAGRVDLLVVNAPYVPSDAIASMPPEARLFEPRAALDGGSDGLDIQRRIVPIAPQWLAPGGHLLIETSERQAPQTAALFERHGLDPHIVHDDDLDGTVVIGRLRSSPGSNGSTVSPRSAA